MGKYSDNSSDDYRRKEKKSKKSKKRRQRSRSRSSSRDRDVSSDRDRDRSRQSRKSRHKQQRRRRHESSGGSSSRSRSSSRSSHTRHHRRSDSRREGHRSSRRGHGRHSSSRSPSRSGRHSEDVKELIEKVKDRERLQSNEGNTEANLLKQMSKSEKLEYKLQKALHDATLADKGRIASQEEEPKVQAENVTSADISDDVRRQETINAIDDDGFVASTFVSSKTSGLASTSGTSYRPADAHAAAMFGTAGTSRVLLDTAPGDLSAGVTASTISSSSAAANRVKLLTGRQLAGDLLKVPAAIKERKWLDKLATLRRRKLSAGVSR